METAGVARQGKWGRTLRAAAMLAALTPLSAPAARAEDLPLPPQVSAVAIPDGQIDAAIGRLDELAAGMLKRSGVPGMAVAVVRDGRTVYAKGFGVRRAGSPEAVDADTVFQLASLSKSVAGTVAAHEVGAGRVAWNTPIVRDLPWFRLSDPWVSEHVTIADLFSHRSGLPDHAGDALEDLGFDRRAVLERLRLLPLAPFRASYFYTNFGLTAAAEAIAQAAGKDWATLSEDVLYKPLGMASTSSRFADFERRTNRASGHVFSDGAFRPEHQRRPDAQSPAGGVSSSANDMARWMSLVLQNGSFEGREIVDPKALLGAISAEVISSPSYAADARPSFYGYGFGVTVSPAGRVQLQHSGAFSMGAATAYTLIPSAGVGIIVLTNAWPIGAAEALAADFADLVQLGRIERDWFPAYRARLEPMNAPVGSLIGKAPPADPAPAASLAAYAGSYASDYFGAAEVVQGGGGLLLRLGPAGIEYPLAHFDGNAFTFHPSSENESDGSISLATFGRREGDVFGSLTLEYLDKEGMGTFTRR